jgi:uncharacterized protein
MREPDVLPGTRSACDLERLLQAIRAESTSAFSAVHGESHWRRVAANGLDLAAHHPLCDTLLVVMFALLHDSMRRNDDWDRHHGLRAADFARRLNGACLLLPETRLATLVTACADHADGKTSADPTIGCCWDADRLDLCRLGVAPRPELMSTAPARRPEAVEAARAHLAQPPTWDAVFERIESKATLNRG